LWASVALGGDVLDNPAVQAFIAIAHKRSCPPNDAVVYSGDVPESIYLILEGSVSAIKEDTDGREILLAYLSPGDFFGEMGLFPQQNERTALIRTRKPTLLAEMNYASFRPFAMKHPEIMFAIAGQLAKRLRDTSRRLSDLAFLDAAGRVASTLIALARTEGVKREESGAVRIQISRQELARCVGCSREVAGRVLKRLEEDGAISCKGRAIYVYGQFDDLPVEPGVDPETEAEIEAEVDAKLESGLETASEPPAGLPAANPASGSAPAAP